MKHVKWFAAAVALLVGSVAAFAHNGIEHVLSTVLAVSGSSITVETLKHESIVTAVDTSTGFTHSQAKASLKDLRKGERVAINAKENAEKKLVAVTVRWGAAAATTTHADHK